MRASSVLLTLILICQLAQLAITTNNRPTAVPGVPLEVIMTEDRTQRTAATAGDYSSVPVVQCAALPQQQRYLATMIVDGIGEHLEREMRLLAARLSIK